MTLLASNEKESQPDGNSVATDRGAVLPGHDDRDTCRGISPTATSPNHHLSHTTSNNSTNSNNSANFDNDCIHHSRLEHSADRFHKLLNFTLNKLLLSSPPKLPRGSTSSLISSQSQIFERSINLSGFISPETPQHCNLENFTNPTLDTTTELITDPKFNYNHIKLNCYDEEADDIVEDSIIPRSRSRSIISNSLMNCLGGSKHDKLSTSPSKDLNYNEDLQQLPTDDNDVTIDFYSFADMLYCEDNGRERKGSCYTISAKDYIGI